MASDAHWRYLLRNHSPDSLRETFQELKELQKRLVVLGSTGSIGTQTLETVEMHPEFLSVVGLSANTKMLELAEQVKRFRPDVVAVGTEKSAAELREILGGSAPRSILVGIEGLVEISQLSQSDMTVVATVGSVGLLPTIASLRAGNAVALANKEVLVMGGDLIMEQAGGVGGQLLPIDSEHSAIFQCVRGRPLSEISQILLTASGGPFWSASVESMRRATVEDALNHPNWSMGSKITIDSATLMNKGLEVIEAIHLFQMDVDHVQVVMHPQSIVHSLVEFQDGSVLAQLGLPDMRLPIQFALSCPQRWKTDFPRLDLTEIGALEFLASDPDRFPCLRIAVEVAREGGTAPTVMSVANEEAVQAFLDGKLGFMDIGSVLAKTMITWACLPLVTQFFSPFST